jgi:sulfatase maturation enzyme AslB (radical SAM superfamily)
MISKTYCAYPFISSSLQADNTVLPCGQFMKSSLFKKIIPINDVRHGPVMEEMRRKMLNGEQVEGCQCYAEEKVGIASMRQSSLNKYGFTTDTTIKKLELVMDNICNIKCRSCGSSNSHIWHEDEITIYGESFSKKKYIKNTLYKDLDLDNLIEIEVLGGEPMYSPGTRDFFKLLKNKGILENLSIQLSTNGTVEPTGYVLEGLLSCKELSLNISIDGFGHYNDYIRSGSNWDTIEQNLRFYDNLIDLRKDKKTSMKVHTAVSIYNVNQLDLLDDYVKEYFPRFFKTFQLVQYPVFLSIKNTPSEYKELVSKYIDNDSITEYLNSEGNDYFQHFINYSHQLDEIRSEDMAEFNPLLKQYIEKYTSKVSRAESKIFLIKEFKKLLN